MDFIYLNHAGNVLLQAVSDKAKDWLKANRPPYIKLIGGSPVIDRNKVNEIIGNIEDANLKVLQ